MKRKQMKNWRFATCAILWLMTTAAASATWEGTWEDLDYEISDDQVTITDCSYFATGDLEIPETIEGYLVTSIGAWAFEDCSGLTSVVRLSYASASFGVMPLRKGTRAASRSAASPIGRTAQRSQSVNTTAPPISAMIRPSGKAMPPMATRPTRAIRSVNRSATTMGAVRGVR